MKKEIPVAAAKISIHAPIEKVWNAFVDPAVIKQYMFDTNVRSDWKEGSAITWSGEWQGKSYEDKGKIIEFKPMSRLKYSHFSPLSGEEDRPDNYHGVTVDLKQQGEDTLVELTQDNNRSEEARQHSEKNWMMMLEGLKKLMEK